MPPQTLQTASPSLVRTVELFAPTDDGQRLWRQRGLYVDEAEGYGRESVEVASGEGAVGAAWASGVAEIQADDAGRGVLAIPCGGQVLALGCDSSDGCRGAFEVWKPDERGELGLANSWYAGLDRLARISPYVKFPRRAGLPGRVWEDRFPRVLGALAESKQFVRVAAARSEQLSAALGVPFMRQPPRLDAVLLLLSTSGAPLARAMEVWARDMQTGNLGVVSAEYGPHVDLAVLSRRTTLRTGEGIAGRVFRDRAPWITHDLLGVEFPRGQRMTDSGFQWGVGLPVFIGDDLVASVNLYL